jgi:hypothetical protein
VKLGRLRRTGARGPEHGRARASVRAATRRVGEICIAPRRRRRPRVSTSSPATRLGRRGRTSPPAPAPPPQEGAEARRGTWPDRARAASVRWPTSAQRGTDSWPILEARGPEGVARGARILGFEKRARRLARLAADQAGQAAQRVQRRWQVELLPPLEQRLAQRDGRGAVRCALERRGERPQAPALAGGGTDSARAAGQGTKAGPRFPSPLRRRVGFYQSKGAHPTRMAAGAHSGVTSE